MRRIIPILIVSTVLSACSVDVSTDLIPTPTSDATALEVPDNEAFAILLLDWRGVADEFTDWIKGETEGTQGITTIGEYVEWGKEGHRTNELILDEWDAIVPSIEAYVGSASLPVTDTQIRRFVSLAEDFSTGYRLQGDPEFNCIDLIPASFYDDPVAKFIDIPGYAECLEDAMSDPLVQRSLDAGVELSTAYNALYIPIFDGG
jgi:hypothetical protein